MLLLSVLSLLRPCPSPCAPPEGARAPIVYYIDYTDKYFTDPAFIDQFAEAPPDVVHVGKSVPITHNWGPVPVLAGENQYTGGPGHTLNWDAIRLLSPEEVRDRIRVITEGVARLHRIGVPRVMPYISFQSIAGDHEKREGFWKFYDHWNDYAEWLGPRPPEDPFKWLAVDQGGRFLPGMCGGYSPAYFAPLHRYRVCPSNPCWRDFSLALVRLIAQCGYDGVFVDNSIQGGEYCPTCRTAFHQFLAGSFTPARLKAFGATTTDPTRLNLGDPGTPAELERRFNAVVVRDRMDLFRREGSRIRPGFQSFPNSGIYDSCLVVGDGCDLYMHESSSSPGATAEGPPPPDRRVTVTVAADAPDTPPTIYRHNARHAESFMEVQAELAFPRLCRLGVPQTIVLKVMLIGDSNQDGDAVEDLRLILENAAAGAKTELPFEPRISVGGGKTVANTVRPPIEVRATWTPPAPGFYAVSLAYTYTDDEHLDTTRHREQVDTPVWSAFYQTHIAALSCAGLARARMILLDYDATRKGWENVQELGHAEAAAFGNGAAIASKGEPERKYQRFFHAHRRLYEGLRPYADVAIIYGLWGGNPGTFLQASGVPVLADALSEQHRLFAPLLDRDVSREALAPYSTIGLVSRHYEMTKEQLAALRGRARQGARLLVANANVAINGRPVAQVLPRVRRWDPSQPLTATEPVAPTTGTLRGVRFAAYVAKPPVREIVVHAVNYNVTLVGEPGRVAPVNDVPIRLRLPAGWRAARVESFDPDAPPGSLPERLAYSQEGTRLTLTLPSLRIYRVVRMAAD